MAGRHHEASEGILVRLWCSALTVIGGNEAKVSMFLSVSILFIFDPCPMGWFFISKDTDNRQPSLPGQLSTFFSGRRTGW
jgi:hypothetical protein